MSKRRLIIIAVPIVVLAIGSILMFTLSTGNKWTSSARRQWKDQAIVKVQDILQTATSPATRPIAAPVGGWDDGNVLHMKNGDWIACQSICNKQDARIADLFIGRGSDGLWYFSTFHFCVGRTVLQMGSQPDSLAQFVDAYWLRSFDGQSNMALQPTWNGEPWGDEKIRR